MAVLRIDLRDDVRLGEASVSVGDVDVLFVELSVTVPDGLLPVGTVPVFVVLSPVVDAVLVAADPALNPAVSVVIT